VVIESNNVFTSDGCKSCGKCPSSFSAPTSFEEKDLWSDLYGSNDEPGGDFTVFPWFLRCGLWKISIASGVDNIVGLGFQVDRIGSLWYGSYENENIETFALIHAMEN